MVEPRDREPGIKIKDTRVWWTVILDRDGQIGSCSSWTEGEGYEPVLAAFYIPVDDDELMGMTVKAADEEQARRTAKEQFSAWMEKHGWGKELRWP